MRLLPLFGLWAASAWGQCAMCFRTAEGQSRAQADALNQGILILALPLMASLALVAVLAYRRRLRTMPNAAASGPDSASRLNRGKDFTEGDSFQPASDKGFAVCIAKNP